ncbi:MAG TPA: AbrB/MazE/SpoVT family DNA-binding domain-containing protein [Thermodesulfobacteriota bacterium]|nr:AbrB/MazE/SpoVT family DNA-binding domain-containing protein [Thermodesulfobacteriota bacterium]
MATVKISAGGQVRIPKEIMEKLKVSAGDYLDFNFEDGNVNVRAKKLIDADQMWFWEKEWQEAERKAEKDVTNGNLSEVFTTAENGISYLRKKRKELNQSLKR